jgi:hypothetical protein
MIKKGTYLKYLRKTQSVGILIEKAKWLKILYWSIAVIVNRSMRKINCWFKRNELWKILLIKEERVFNRENKFN